MRNQSCFSILLNTLLLIKHDRPTFPTHHHILSGSCLHKCCCWFRRHQAPRSDRLSSTLSPTMEAPELSESNSANPSPISHRPFTSALDTASQGDSQKCAGVVSGYMSRFMHKVCQAEPLRHLNCLSASRCRKSLIDSVLLAYLNHATKIRADFAARLGKPRRLPASQTRLQKGQLALVGLDQPWSGRTRCSPATNEWNNTSGQCVRSLRRLATRSADSVSAEGAPPPPRHMGGRCP